MRRMINQFVLVATMVLVTGLNFIGCSSTDPKITPAETPIPLPGVPGLNTSDVDTELDGFIQVEAESFQSNNNKGTTRNWVLINEDTLSEIAGGKAYMAVVPDTRITHDDSLILGTNFFPESGTGSILSYKTYFNTPGLYYVWVSCFSTGSEDNSVNVGIDGYWPESSARVQWCEGKNQWTWSSAQRVEDNHCGTPRTITLDILEPGYHTITFSVREDGFKFDQWLMTLDKRYQP